MEDSLSSLQYGTFTVELDGRYLVVIPDMHPAAEGITPLVGILFIVYRPY